MSSVLVLSHAEVLVALPPDECADAMAEVLVAHARGEAQMPLRSMVPFQGAEGFMGLMPAWRGGMAELATCPNVLLKLGGIGMPRFGFDWHLRDTPIGGLYATS